MKGWRGSTRLALDGGVLLALALGEPGAEGLRDAIGGLEVEALTHELSVVEMTYVLCRRAGPAVALRKKSLLLRSGVVRVVSVSELADEAALIKCERAISLADCFTIALARVYGCPAVFAKKEKELEREMERRPFNVEMLFLME